MQSNLTLEELRDGEAKMRKNYVIIIHLLLKIKSKSQRVSNVKNNSTSNYVFYKNKKQRTCSLSLEKKKENKSNNQRFFVQINNKNF